MKKKIIAAATGVLLLLPGIIQAAVNAPEDFMPGNATITADFQLSAGRIKNLLMPFFEAPLKELSDAVEDGEESAQKAKIVVDKFLAGEKFFVGFTLPQSFSITFPVTDTEWATLTENSESHKYGETEVFYDGSFYITKLGGFAILGDSQESLHQNIDLASGTSTDSLSNNALYKNVTKSYFAPRLLGYTINIKAIAETVVPLLAAGAGAEGEQIMKGAMTLISLFEWMGASLAEVSDGYKFNFKIVGNADKLREHGLNFNPGGNFTPNLYKKFPKAKPILYTESFNPKANNDQEKKILKLMKESLDLPEDINLDTWEALKEETGFDVNEIYNALDREIAVGLQYDQNSPLPYLTIMADVNNNKTAGFNLIGDITKTLKKILEESDVPTNMYKITENLTKNAASTKFTFDVMKIDDYDGPPFPKIVVTFSVNPDGILMISNYSGDDWTGFALEETGPNTGIFYLNMRNLWGWFDSMAEWGERAGGGEHGPPLDFYQGYYSVLENIYGWRDLLLVSTGTESESVVTGTINIDQAKHKTYEQLLEEIKSSDRDGDGISDYEERYVYNTSVESGDSDNDGVEDFEELQKGFNPEGEGRLWSDVSEDAYYTDETAFLYQRGAIKGYDDGTFKPGQLVNRAEFTTMIVKAFEQGTSEFLGVDVELKAKAPPFVDLDSVAWYYPYVSKAYAAGFISGSRNPVTGELEFQPGKDITRAEAIAILNKASDALSKTKPQVSCADSVFDDVPEDAWFCDEVANAYANGVTKGKSTGKFAPNEPLNRGDAAVMIRRTLEKDISHFEEGTQSVGELAAPLVPGGSALFRGLPF